MRRVGTRGCFEVVCGRETVQSCGLQGIALTESARYLRNLHQYRHARHKSLVKERRRFSRNWYLQAGNNYEFSETKGHEREAFENFGVYRNDSDNDHYVLSTADLKLLPAEQRLDAIHMLMEDRWKVKDGNKSFDKTKMVLMALECFAEMRELNRIPCFAEMEEADQDQFLQFADSCRMMASRCSHAHPDAVAAMIRAAEICDVLEAREKRDEILESAEKMTHALGRSLAYEREGEEIRLPKPTFEENGHLISKRNDEEIQRLYPNLRLDKPKPRNPLPHLAGDRLMPSPRFQARERLMSLPDP